MSLALALSLALLTQQAATTQVTQVNGTMQFQLYWDYDDNGDALILELTGASITDINGTKPLQAVSMNFKDIQLNLPPAQKCTEPLPVHSEQSERHCRPVLSILRNQLRTR